MTLDYQQVRQQVQQLGENALKRETDLQARRERACQLLQDPGLDVQRLCEKVQMVARQVDPGLRCALPVREPLDGHFPLPQVNLPYTVLAVDGSQINPDRHAEVVYGLINIGAIQMRSDSAEAPQPSIRSQLIYDEDLYTPGGTISEETLALKRDLLERRQLAELAGKAAPPVITFTDGPLELWGAKDTGGGEPGQAEFRHSLELYQQALHQLREMDATTAGYVDKPGADLVVRLLEIAMTSQDDLWGVKKERPLRGVTEFDLYADYLQPGERSAVFAMQSQSAHLYPDELALHFFYLNVGRGGDTWLARVEVPAWVVNSTERLNSLHAALVQQCRIMGTRPYPYLLHRAHETALVTLEERQQVTQMIVLERRRRGLSVGKTSAKQSAKGLAGRRRYTR